MRPVVKSLLVVPVIAAAACSSSSQGNKKAPVTHDGGPGGARDSGAKHDSGSTTTKSDWPALGLDLSSTYHNRAEKTLTPANVKDLTVAWDLTTPGGIQGAAAIVGDTAYVLGTSLYALDVKTGKKRWENPDVNGQSSPTVVDGVVYVNSSAAGEYVAAVDAVKGTTLWSVEVDPHPNAAGASSPVVVGNRVIVGNASFEESVKKDGATFRGGVVAFDATNKGKELWRFDTVMAPAPANGCAVWSTVSVDEAAGRVFAVTGNNYTETATAGSDSVFALDLATGKQIWHTQASTGDVFTILNPKSPDSDFGANPILYEARVEGGTRKLLGVGQKSGDFWSFDRETGKVVWKRSLGGGSAVGGILNNGAYDGERILVASTGVTSTAPGSEASNGDTTGNQVGTIFALDPATGDILWERQLPAAIWAPITVANGVGFVAAETHLEAFDPGTGQKLFDHKVDGTISSAPVVSNGRVFFGSGMSLVIFGHTDNKFHVLAVPGAP